MDTLGNIVFILCLSEASLQANGGLPSLEHPYVNVTLVEGHTAVLPCSVENLGNHKVVWMGSSHILLTYDDHRIIDDQRISVERPYQKDWNLHIRKVSLKDSGIYKCSINTDPVKSAIVNLQVKANVITPELDQQDINVTMVEGYTAILPCSVGNLGDHKVVWLGPTQIALTLEDRRITRDQRISVGRPYRNDWNLRIREVSLKDSGIYTCSINSDPVMSAIVNLQVKATVITPELDQQEVNVTVIERVTVILPCSVRNLGNHTVQWMGTDKSILSQAFKVLSNDPRFSVEHPHIQVWNLHIRNISAIDTGRYMCSVNTRHAMSKIVNLLVQVPTKLIEDMSSSGYVTVDEGGTLRLHCNMTGVPAPEVSWSFGSNNYFPTKFLVNSSSSDYINQEGERVHLVCKMTGDPTPVITWSKQNDTEIQFVLENVSKSDEGEYTCLGYNGVGRSVSHTVKVDVYLPTKFLVNSSSSDYINQEGERVHLVCKMTGDPTPVITWSKQNDTEILHTGEVLVFEKVSRYDHGIYTCTGYNGKGPKVRHDIKVEVYFAPVVSTGTKRIEQFPGKDIILECRVFANPFGVITWKKNNEMMISHSPRKYKMDMYIHGPLVRILSLKIQDLNCDDFGKYTCFAANALGEDQASIELIEYIEETSTCNDPKSSTQEPVKITTSAMPSREEDSNEVLKTLRLEYYRERIITDRKSRHLFDLQEVYYRTAIKYLNKLNVTDGEVKLLSMITK